MGRAGLAWGRAGGCLGAGPALLPVERAALAEMGNTAAGMGN